MQSSFCLYLMHHENGNAGLNKRETGIEAFSPVARVFQRLAPWKPCNGEKSIRPLHWLLCFSSAKSWGAAVGGSITPNF